MKRAVHAAALTFGLGCAVLAVAAGRLQRRCERWLDEHDPADVQLP